MVFLKLLLVFLAASLFLANPAYAIVDPLAVPNNKFGIHIISASPDESSPAASLVNTNGDWGYITFLIESKDRNESKWQQFFNDLRRRHLIPIVRLATKPLNAHWERPYEGEEEAWADFLDKLNWPTENRYVVIYNEPNHGAEWNLQADPASYAKVLDKTVEALKKKSADFFVLNAGFDASTPHQPPKYFDEVEYLKKMEETVPGIFEKLDGWVSHSYPNPAFMGSPADMGRGTVRTWYWELQILGELGVKKNFPVFITETGWKHAEGLSYNYSYPKASQLGDYFKQAFAGAWSSQRIVVVSPFLLNYQEAPFDHFSFVKLERQETGKNFYEHYLSLQNLPKVAGKPIQENKAELVSGKIFKSLVVGQSYNFELVFKNTGQSIWGDNNQVTLMPLKGTELGLTAINLPQVVKVAPGEKYPFKLTLKAKEVGKYSVSFNLFSGNKEFDSPSLRYEVEVKSPVVLVIKTALQWKNSFAGKYLLLIEGPVATTVRELILPESGQSEEVEAQDLLPDYSFNFTLQRPFYQPKTINQKVLEGENTLDFGTLQPDFLPALLHPIQLWKLLPWSN